MAISIFWALYFNGAEPARGHRLRLTDQLRIDGLPFQECLHSLLAVRLRCDRRSAATSCRKCGANICAAATPVIATAASSATRHGRWAVAAARRSLQRNPDRNDPSGAGAWLQGVVREDPAERSVGLRDGVARDGSADAGHHHRGSACSLRRPSQPPWSRLLDTVLALSYCLATSYPQGAMGWAE